MNYSNAITGMALATSTEDILIQILYTMQIIKSVVVIATEVVSSTNLYYLDGWAANSFQTLNIFSSDGDNIYFIYLASATSTTYFAHVVLSTNAFN